MSAAVFLAQCIHKWAVKYSFFSLEHMEAADIASRYGGEEFAILLFNRPFEEAFTLLERIRTQIAETFYEELEGKAVTISIGLKAYTDGITKESMFGEVDTLLYTAKRTGKNRTATSSHNPLSQMSQSLVESRINFLDG
ncbi:MAG: GGDEF domain-containing protein [Gorillibacterium sp.]|nr:GGDEF domain-containing protein [Gorillibacterium sp.]